MDKKVLYALIGGVAVVGAAVAYHLASKSAEEADDGIDEDLDQLGEPQYEPNGMLRFDYFLKVFQICSFYGKNQFNIKKRELITQRRLALADNDDKKYEQIVMDMTQQEEMLIQSKLMEIIEKIGLSEQDFQRNTMYHGQDQRKGMQIMQMQQQTANTGGDDLPLLTKEQVMSTFKVQQEIQMESMDAMMKDGMANPQTQDGQMAMMMKMMVQQSKAQDKLFEKTGVEEDQLNSSIQRLNL